MEMFGEKIIANGKFELKKLKQAVTLGYKKFGL
jgi:hypothetical protein